MKKTIITLVCTLIAPLAFAQTGSKDTRPGTNTAEPITVTGTLGDMPPLCPSELRAHRSAATAEPVAENVARSPPARALLRSDRRKIALQRRPSLDQAPCDVA